MVSKSKAMNTIRVSRSAPAEFMATGCQQCPLMKQCGGMKNDRALLTCIDQFCCGKPDCDNVCPNNLQYARQVNEISGFGRRRIGQLQQRDVRLPAYVPLVQHGYRRESRLLTEAVAISPYRFMKLKNRLYGSTVKNQSELRAKFGVADHAQLILCGTEKDRPLEMYWAYRERDKAMDAIAALKPDLFIAPNFSMFLDVPRQDNLFNIKRQLLCISELSAAGVSVVPHISATMPQDWENWRSFLAEQTDIQHIAFNFQTGYGELKEGRKAISRLIKLQQSLGRDLSLIMIAGSQFIPDANLHFARLTVIDSTPFLKTTMRRRLVMNGTCKKHWVSSRTELGAPIDNLLQRNVDGYSKHIAEMLGRLFA